MSAIKMPKEEGYVEVSKKNVLITLAPYFFPFYTVCTMVAYGLLSLFWDMALYEPFWLGLTGLTWSFHLTFTLSTLQTHQPNIQEHGRIFSYTPHLPLQFNRSKHMDYRCHSLHARSLCRSVQYRFIRDLGWISGRSRELRSPVSKKFCLILRHMKDNLEHLMAYGNNRSFMPTTYHQTLVKPLELRKNFTDAPAFFLWLRAFMPEKL
ncbi:MAG: hypothetical protein GKR87_00855 [Kiritimatiellae bacterium]|nr:hypothetical protein [Kiritimatiellia bacterium]